MANLVGKKLKGRYQVKEFLGRGGMAEVYKVWDTQRGVPLAMKVLREDLAEDVVFMRRFEREAQNLTRLQHPNIVRCYGLEREGHTAFMLMDYIEGWTLRREIYDAYGALPIQRILEIMQPVCSALHYAHQMGMVHCDVKSANIMIHKNGTVYLTDFGIARGMDAATSTMVGIGTPAYMAPELVKGQDPTPQTDIYALGIVLYEMLTGGERPFTGERATITGTTAEKVRWEQIQLIPTPPSRYNAKISVKMEALVLQCLEKDTRQRMQSAMAVQQALLSGAPLLKQTAKNSKEASPFQQQTVQEVNTSQPVRKTRPSIWRQWYTWFGLATILVFSLVVLLHQDKSSLLDQDQQLIRHASTQRSEPTATTQPTATSEPDPILANTARALAAFQNDVFPFATSQTFMSGSHPLFFSNGWSSTDYATLADNLNNMDWTFWVDYQVVADEQVSSNTFTYEDYVGKVNFILVDEFPQGEHHIQIDFNIYETIFDGWGEYEPQQMSYTYDVYVTPGSSNADYWDLPIVYYEDFTYDNGYWWTGTLDTNSYYYNGAARIYNGAYVMEVYADNEEVIYDYTYPDVSTVGDFYLSATVWSEGDMDYRGCYGLNFLDYYEFEICDDRGYRLYYSGDESYWSIPWTDSLDILVGERNEIAVLKQDEVISLYINGVYQTQVEDYSQEAGIIGITISANNYPSQFYFDDITIRMP